MSNENSGNTDLFYEESKEVVNKQLSRTEMIESRAGRILRVSMLTVGVILTALSIGVRWVQNSQQTFEPIPNDAVLVYFAGALLAIGGAAIFSAMAYTAAPIRFGPSGDDIRRLFDNDGGQTTKKELLAGYSLWSDINRKPLEKSRFWITCSMTCIVLAPIYLALVIASFFVPASGSLLVHALLGGFAAVPTAHVMQVHPSYRSYSRAKQQSREAQEDFWRILEDREIEHVLEGASFGGEEENESKLRQMVLGRALENWVEDHLNEIVPDFDKVIQKNDEPGMLGDNFIVAQEDGTRVAIEAKTRVDSRTAEEVLNKPSTSADPLIDLYVVSLEFTESAKQKLVEKDGVHFVEVDRNRVKNYSN